jgi:guanylate kinase
MENLPPHINISSYAGGGKTTIANYLLNSGYKVFMIPRITSRPRRPDEAESSEYIFVSPEDFEVMETAGHIFASNPVVSHGKIHKSGVLKREFWSDIPDQVDFIISIFGLSKVHEIESNFPDMVNVFIDFKDKTILNDRLRLRCLKDNSDYETKVLKNAEYDTRNLKSLFKHIVHNDSSPEECIEQILTIFKNQSERF